MMLIQASWHANVYMRFIGGSKLDNLLKVAERSRAPSSTWAKSPYCCLDSKAKQLAIQVVNAVKNIEQLTP